MREHDLQLLSEKLQEIKDMGWIENRRPGNVGGVGNTIEDLLEVAENNLQLPDFGEWELKTQRADTSSLLTLFHSEPLPRNARIVPNILLPKYGWPHQEAGTRYPDSERSFRQTISTSSRSDRGFMVNIDYDEKVFFIDFDYGFISDRHAGWREDVRRMAGTDDIDPNPYWTFDDIEKKLHTKLNNLMFISADRRMDGTHEFFKYNRFEVYVDPTLDRFISLVEDGAIYVDFDARTGHNHGTKFRIRTSRKPDLYEYEIEI